MNTNPIIFAVKSLLLPSIYTPIPVEEDRPHYGAMIDDTEAPKELCEWLGESQRVTALYGRPLDRAIYVYRLFGANRPPAVIADEPLDTIISCTRAANLNPDLLLVGIPALVSVRCYEVNSARFVGPRKRASVAAIKVSREDMTRRYAEVCAEFFADPSLPYRGPPVRA